MHTFTSLVERGAREGVSDMHISGGHPIVYRKNGSIVFVDTVVLTPSQVDALVLKMLGPRHLRILRERLSVDLGMNLAGIRLRVNIFNTVRGLAIATRFLPAHVPTLTDLNLHPALTRFCSLDSGLVLFCGPTGSGKSTTIASLLDKINATRAAHAITLEDPIEYSFRSGKAFFQQRELGEHFLSFEQGLVDILREDPDIIMVGELRDPETIRLTLSAAESGHLVFASLHASNMQEAIYRICNSFPLEAQEFVRHQLASCLGGIVVQKLIYEKRLGFRIPHLSMLFPSPAIGNTVRENKIEQIHNIMELSKDKDVYTFSRYRKEFLNTKNRFTPPWNTLTPRITAKATPRHTSSVLTSAQVAPQEDIDASSTRCVSLDGNTCQVDEIITRIESRGMGA
ncbi:type IV pilus twitching motility protein PilT [Desulfoplanes formicivorans]|uniref:Twitching motility protein PilT n=1 Tax=Desulfoplanes formicivorans TaxID=1592317 RepID=A0A194AI04_9BACT|nr:ATPase, T2SS/T4P/T4SS family [Desulfoplanes formicivorans]GAU08958.1 twitching motility protein PilT [Desulfoplanes formicivorans]